VGQQGVRLWQPELFENRARKEHGCVATLQAPTGNNTTAGVLEAVGASPGALDVSCRRPLRVAGLIWYA
jgi:hypothetical protein